MLLKFRLSGAGSAAAGTVLAIPQSVWDSWQPFLGGPSWDDDGTGVMRLRPTADAPDEPLLNAYICVFDLDASSPDPIWPVNIRCFVRVSPERLAHHAFTEVPAHITRSIQAEDSVLSTITARLGAWWPAFGHPVPRRR
jgi:hypothetical protein